MAVFVVVGCLSARVLFLKTTGLTEEKGVFGGPAPASPTLLSNAEGAEPAGTIALGSPSGNMALIQSPSVGEIPDSTLHNDSLSYALLPADGLLRDIGEPVGPSFDRSGTLAYNIQRGDNLSKIASYFGISIDTIIAANPGVRAGLLRTGQTLKILPTSGVIYHAQAGDTLESISAFFGISSDQIVKFNPSVHFAYSIDPDISIVIPGGKNMNRLATGGAALPNYNSQFIMPTSGYDWGILHHYNAVDISNSCGTPVVASAEGLVIPDESMPQVIDGWNGGYGNFVLIEHPFGDNVRTRYAHLEKALVQIGDYVKQGDVIGYMGETGDATGCHVHFEVYGAENPFAKK